MPITVAIAGATGYAGGELLRLLLGHPAYLKGDLEIGALTGNSSAGQCNAFPAAPALTDRVVEETTPEVLSGHDVVFLCLPHGHSARLAAQLPAETLVIDCAADYRLSDPEQWRRYYGSEHAGTWPYGLPEMPGQREALTKTRRVAVPGCFPTGATLALLPAVAEGLIEPNITLTSITGVSGAGKKAATSLLGAETMGSVRPYNTAGQHRHNPEIVQNLACYGETPRLSFTPVLAPMTRGILSTAVAPLKSAPLKSGKNPREVYAEFYRGEPFVHVLPEGVLPNTKNVLGTNLCQIAVEINEEAGTLLITAAIDNLTKGTAGGAVQCMNIAVGWEEVAGLPTVAVTP
ncbi:N-acetyl-gamma-glutamyl-phosphate reductase [Corynebacterium lowii]|uniref:N-acetyl-gamma-glutamyl-phosphate reductase n=1 Tax=Corynebacterium lowii TaxID=1544413 RepID=A0A0Q0YVS9_9CORY|nr:N-acetyl-gamma-glutamyl-phosphate reductase [Corynebacterium lowii]KQB86472.1 N-acetyl-gamma-glutamyl-phosphate reductase [Corynebacterium lowii]MDP9850956.1 N-acetyl-gamma-glutamyl-phosphate reductase [Corynebacterium lowii]